MGYAIEVIGTWYGIEIPSWLRAFDCRANDAATSPWGTSLWSSERAEVDMGLRTATSRNATTPVSCSTYTDARRADDAELARQVTRMVEEATRIRAEYLAAKDRPAQPGSGGSCLYLPVAVCMANYGWSVVCDERTMIVRAFS